MRPDFPATAVANPDTARSESTLSVRARILLVDDDQLLRSALPAELKDFHVEALGDFGSAATALKRGQPFDVLLLDLELADGRSAFDLVLLARACGRDVPALLLAPPDRVDASLTERARAAGFADVIAKDPDLLRGRSLETRLVALLERHRRRAERDQRARRSGDDRPATLVDLVDDAIVELDRQLTVTWANAAACRALGRSREELIGRPCGEALPPHDCRPDGAGGACIVRRALSSGQKVSHERQAAGRFHASSALRFQRDGLPAVMWRESDVTPVRQLEQQLEASLHTMEAAHQGLQMHADRLERVLRASTDLKQADTVEELADRVLHVLSELPGFGLVAIGLMDEERGTTQLTGIACVEGGTRLELGRRTVLLDLMNLSPDRRRVGHSFVIEGWSISVQGAKAVRRSRLTPGEWDLEEVFDGTAVALTPLRGTGRPHGFLLVKAAAHGQAIDAGTLPVVEILANLAGVGFDNLRLQEVERRRARWSAMVERLGRRLMDEHAPEDVLALAAAALASEMPAATVQVEVLRPPRAPRRTGTLRAFERAFVWKADADRETGALALAPTAAQLVIPLHLGDRVRALLTAASSAAAAFDELDLAALESFREVVAKAYANAQSFVEEQRSLGRLRLVAEIGRIAVGSLETDEMLATALARLCQHAEYETAIVSLVDRDRGKLVMKAHASRRGARLVEGLSTPLTSGITGAVASTGAPVLVHDVLRDPRYVAVDDHARSELCVPLRVQEDVVGVLDVESSQPGAFDDSDLVAVTSVADHLASALHNSRLFEEVRAKNRELRASEKNKTEFLAVVAHDLRTPLTSIRSAADLLVTYRDEPPEVTAEFLAAIRDEAARLGRLVDDFLAYARMEAGILDYEVQEFDLVHVLAHFARVFEGPAAQRGQSIECRAPADLPPVLADPERVAQVVANLLSNANKYSLDGGRIVLSATLVPPEPGQVLGFVRVDVADSGPGIEENDRERIFQKFVRLDATRDVRGGAGLGLPIARSIVEHLGGRLWFDSQPGAGTTFSFTLPARLGSGDGQP